MAARRLNLGNAVIELGFVAAASILGAMGAPIWIMAALIGVTALYWWWSRRRVLAGMASSRQKFTAGAASIAILGVVLTGAFFAGRFIGGNT